MKTVARWFGFTGLLLGVLFTTTACAQTPVNDSSATASANATETPLSAERLDVLLAPIALYPDALLSQVLMATTYPLEVIEAARWQQTNEKLSGEALATALEAQTWDASVKSLLMVPNVLQQMNNEVRWMEELGAAVLADQTAVLARVQVLRQMAKDAGNLASNDKQVVTTETELAASGTNKYILIASKSPELIYVPVYDTRVVYGNWHWASAPFYWSFPGVVLSSGWSWGPAFRFGFGLWGGFSWSNGWLTINAPVYRHYFHRPPPRHPIARPLGHNYVWWRGQPPRSPVFRPRPQAPRPPMLRPYQPPQRPMLRPYQPPQRPMQRPYQPPQRPMQRPNQPAPRFAPNQYRPPRASSNTTSRNVVVPAPRASGSGNRPPRSGVNASGRPVAKTQSNHRIVNRPAPERQGRSVQNRPNRPQAGNRSSGGNRPQRSNNQGGRIYQENR